MKYWDIIPPKKAKKKKLDIKEIMDFLEKINELNKEPIPYLIPPIRYNESPTLNHCLHKNCPGCRNGTCSGIHMISCPCRECTPFFITSGSTTMGVNTLSVIC